MRFLLMVLIAVLVGFATGSFLWAFLTFLALAVLWVVVVFLGMLLVLIGIGAAVNNNARKHGW